MFLPQVSCFGWKIFLGSLPTYIWVQTRPFFSPPQLHGQCWNCYASLLPLSFCRVNLYSILSRGCRCPPTCLSAASASIWSHLNFNWIRRAHRWCSGQIWPNKDYWRSFRPLAIPYGDSNANAALAPFCFRLRPSSSFLCLLSSTLF